MTEGFLNVKEACEFLGVSRATLDSYARQKRITRYRQGAPVRTMYRIKDLRALQEIKMVRHERPTT